MTKISLLGALYLPFVVRQWNESSDIELKKYAHMMTMSGNTAQMHKGLEKIFEIFDAGAKRSEFVPNLGHLYHFILGPLFELSDREQDFARKAQAMSDVGFYFVEMFKLGHFEQLPMPNFGYELPEMKAFNSCSLETLMKGATEIAAEHHLPRPSKEIRFGPPYKLKPGEGQDP